MSNKYSNILTMVLIVIIVAIVGICFYYGYDYYTQEAGEEQTKKVVEQFNNSTSKKKVVVAKNTTTKNEVSKPENVADLSELYENILSEPEVEEPVVEEQPVEREEPEKQYLEGYEIVGTIRIPKTGIEYPVLSQVTKKSLETSVAILYGPGVNVPGNTVIVGHNYRNKRFFSNNDKLASGDEVILTDVYGETVTYIIYNMYYTSPDDAEYMLRNVEEGVREISLSTCNDDSSQRLIIWAREK